MGLSKFTQLLLSKEYFGHFTGYKFVRSMQTRQHIHDVLEDMVREEEGEEFRTDMAMVAGRPNLRDCKNISSYTRLDKMFSYNR